MAGASDVFKEMTTKERVSRRLDSGVRRER